MTAEGEKRRLIDFSQQKMQDANGHVQLGHLQSMTAEQSRTEARDTWTASPAMANAASTPCRQQLRPWRLVSLAAEGTDHLLSPRPDGHGTGLLFQAL
jgi:hypothetical protein